MATKKNNRRGTACRPLARRYISLSPARTLALAERFARRLPAGAVVFLDGPLGAGKTVFVQGMARAFGVDSKTVHSPSFLLMHDYGGMVHIDCYRLLGAREDELVEAGLWEALESKAVKAVEWPPSPLKRSFRGALRVRIRFAEGDHRLIDLPDILKFPKARKAVPNSKNINSKRAP